MNMSLKLYLQKRMTNDLKVNKKLYDESQS